MTAALAPNDFSFPAIRLAGQVDYAMYIAFRGQFIAAAEQPLVVVELSTLGGDPEVARMMGEDIRFASEMAPERRFVFLGKAAIYSAGTTFMSFFARTEPLRHAWHPADDSRAQALQGAAHQRAADHLHRDGEGDAA